MKMIAVTRMALAIVSMGVLALSASPPAMAKHADKERSREQDYRQYGAPNGYGDWQSQSYPGSSGQWSDRGSRGEYRHDNGLHKGWYKNHGRRRNQRNRGWDYQDQRDYQNQRDYNRSRDQQYNRGDNRGYQPNYNRNRDRDGDGD